MVELPNPKGLQGNKKGPKGMGRKSSLEGLLGFISGKLKKVKTGNKSGKNSFLAKGGLRSLLRPQEALDPRTMGATQKPRPPRAS